MYPSDLEATNKPHPGKVKRAMSAFDQSLCPATPVTPLWLQGGPVFLEGSCHDSELHDSLTKQWWGGSGVIRKGMMDFGDTQEMFTSSPCLSVLPLKFFLTTLSEISHLSS